MELLGNALPHPNLSPLLRDRLVLCSITCANNDMWVKNNGAPRLASTKSTNTTSDNGGSLQQTSGLAKPAGRVVSLGLGRVSMQDAPGEEAADAEDSPLAMTSCSAPSLKTIVI